MSDTDLWTAVDEYINATFIGSDAALEAALRSSAEAGLPPIAVAPNQGKMLHLMARMIGARRILEVGTLGGYSAIWMARALPAGGRLVTLELDPRHAEVARANLERAGVGEAVEIRVGAAAETLRGMIASGEAPFDLVFIDADKPSGADYFQAALQLSHAGTAVVVDNVVRHGGVIDATSTDPAVLGTRRLNDVMAAEPRVSVTEVQTVGLKGHDGFALALVNG
ncbi:MAG: O-methyltransferase [Candidatus Dormibacteria bacterium]